MRWLARRNFKGSSDGGHLAVRPNPAPPLRVALVSSSLRLAGAEKQTVYLTRALREAGTDVLFFHLGEGGHYENMLRQMGVPLVRIYAPNRPLFMLAQLSWAWRRFRPEIAFAPQFGDLLQTGIAGRLCHALVVGGIRSDGFYEFNGHGRRSTWMLRLAHGLIANSHRAGQNMTSLGADASRIKILSNVLDLHEFDAQSRLSPPAAPAAQRVIAVAVGSLQPCKRFDRFLNALALARRTAPALLGVLAGADQGCRPALEQQADQLGLSPAHVVFLGECENVPALLTHAGFLVLCSEYEGFPNVILEAMAARLPVITTAVGDAARIVIEGQTGFVVDGDDAALARRMSELALCTTTRRRLGAEGRARVFREYNYGSLATRLFALFHDFADQNRRAALSQRLQDWLPSKTADSLRPL